MIKMKILSIILLVIFSITIEARLSLEKIDKNAVGKNENKQKTPQEKLWTCPRDCICSTNSDKVSLARCNRLEVNTQVFSDNITDLIVENINSPIFNLGDMIFQKLGLNQVMNVKMVDNMINNISSTAFSGLNELFSVNLTGNKIDYLDPNTFVKNKELNLLSLANNPLLFSKMTPTSIFLKSITIQELDVSNCDIENISKYTFSNMDGLLYIDLSGNKIKKIDPEAFVQLVSLEEINLSNNQLTALPTDLFLNNVEMATLSLRNNPLTDINGFQVMQLLTLDVSNAKIKTIKASTFKESSILSTLILSGNEINKISTDAISNLYELTYLDLSNNDLDFIDEKLIKDNVMLDTFKIANNTKLTALPENGFACKEDSFTTYLFDASGCSLEVISNKTFITMPSLTTLNLARNRIRMLGSSLYPATQLSELDLSHNSIEILDTITFSKNTMLKKLNLAGNPLVTISIELFKMNSLLMSLDVSSSQLVKLWDPADTASSTVLNNLLYLNASDNQLLSITTDELKMTSNLTTLDIFNNPLHCDKNFEKLMKWLGDHKISPVMETGMISNLEMKGEIKNKHQTWKSLAKEVCENDLYSDDIEEDSNKSAYKDDAESLEDDSMDEDDDDDDDVDYAYYNSKEYESFDDPTEKTTTAKEVIDTNKKTEEKKIEHTTSTTEKPKNNNYLIRPIGETDDLIDRYEVEFKNKTIELFNDPDDDSSDDEDEDDYADDEKYLQEGDIFDREVITPVYSDSFVTRELLYIIFVIALLFSIAFLLILRKTMRDRAMRCVAGRSLGNVRAKKDCGLVYQPLSEDLTGPRTPIIRKHNFISNISISAEETNPFQHTKVFPEAV